jgi:asparagine synthase (glutamine-hydrolysing)
MCGITGYFSRSTFTIHDLQTMTQLVSHRGPDAEGTFTDEVCGLGHRRLSILDLSDRANQPMHSRDGRYVMVFNGEIYNYREIARELHLSLRTSSDSEVILEAFAREGIQAVNRFNGMFAFAIYDKSLRELYIFRDRAGIKPLFYYWDGHNLAFASELKSLAKLSRFSKAVNLQAVNQFLNLGYIPAPYTIYNDIYKLPAGNYLQVSAGGVQTHVYWSLAEVVTASDYTDELSAKVQLESLLTSSVKYQMISDVPLGIFLSGGIDSSLITALAVKQSANTINTFSIGFEESKYSEAAYAKEVARHLGTTHHELIVTAREARDLVETMMDVYDEPYADSSAIPTMLVSAFARRQVKVVLCGDGADELFFGYGMYQWAQRLAQPGLKLFKTPLAKVLKHGRQDKYQKAAGMLDYEASDCLPSHIFSQEQGFFSRKELKELLHTSYLKGFCLPTLQVKRNLYAIEAQSLFDMQYYLPDDLLVKVDRASMQYGLEARVPYLDHRIVEFALNLSPDLKYQNGISKYLLKEILYQYVPKLLFDRPKRGFSIPLHEWLRKDLKYLLDDYLNESVVEKAGVVKYGQVKALKRDFLEGNSYVYNRLWVLIVLHRFLLKD